MNSLSASRFPFEYTIFFSKSLWIHYFFAKSIWIYYLLRDFTIISLSGSRIHLESTFSPNQYELTICFAIPLWIHYHFREITMNTLSLTLSRIDFLFREFCMNSLSVSAIHYLFLEFTIMNSLWYHYETTMKSIWIHYLFRDSTMNSLSFSRNHYKYIFLFANFLRIHYLIRDFSLNSISVWQLTIFFVNCLWINICIVISLWFHNLESRFLMTITMTITICFAILHYLFGDSTLNSLSFSRNHYEYTIFFANWFSVSRISYEFTIWFAISLLIHYI